MGHVLQEVMAVEWIFAGSQLSLGTTDVMY